MNKPLLEVTVEELEKRIAFLNKKLNNLVEKVSVLENKTKNLPDNQA